MSPRNCSGLFIFGTIVTPVRTDKILAQFEFSSSHPRIASEYLNQLRSVDFDFELHNYTASVEFALPFFILCFVDFMRTSRKAGISIMSS